MRGKKKVCKREVQAHQCGTCPFREGSPYAYLAPALANCALTTSSRICHATGKNAISGETGKPEKLCRGARDVQLSYFKLIGFIDEATDEAWSAKRKELGIDEEEKEGSETAPGATGARGNL